jgi:hypothetical protein
MLVYEEAMGKLEEEAKNGFALQIDKILKSALAGESDKEVIKVLKRTQKRVAEVAATIGVDLAKSHQFCSKKGRE